MREAVRDLMVVALVGDEDVCRRSEARWHIQRASLYADVTAARPFPEQLRAASATKSPPTGLGGLIPTQSLGGRQSQVCARAGGRRHEMSV